MTTGLLHHTQIKAAREIIGRGGAGVEDDLEPVANLGYPSHAHRRAEDYGLTPDRSQMLPFTLCMGSTSLPLARPIPVLRMSG